MQSNPSLTEIVRNLYASFGSGDIAGARATHQDGASIWIVIGSTSLG